MGRALDHLGDMAQRRRQRKATEETNRLLREQAAMQTDATRLAIADAHREGWQSGYQAGWSAGYFAARGG